MEEVSDRKIIIKEIDKYKSKQFKNKTISEYIIYLMNDDIKLETFVVIGEEEKNKRVDMLLSSSFKTKINGEEYKNIVETIINN